MINNLSGFPSHWDTSRLDRVATVNARIGWKALTSAEYQPEGYAFLATPNIKGAEIDYVNVNYISEFRYNESPELKLQEGDVLLAKDGNTLGIVNIVRKLPRPATVNGSIAVLRPFGIHGRFLRYVIASSFMQGRIDAVKDGMGVPHLFQRDIKRLPLPLPPVDEQRRIADFLDVEIAHIDKMRQATSRQVDLLAERFMELVRRETTVGLGPSVSTGIDWMPRMSHGWRLGKVSHEFHTGSGTTPTSSNQAYFDGPHPWLNSADINDGHISRIEKSVTEEALAKFSALKIYPAGSLVIALYGQGATKGRVGALGIDACLNQACCALIPIGEISVEFAQYWFRGHKEGIITLAVGAGQPNLSQELIRQLKIPFPDKGRQRRIVERLHGEEERWQLQSALLRSRGELLEERRQALITAAVTGQVDVTTARRTATA
ncbi:restriction endonuclease subunit S [Streptomyces longwoodensis]|uniref:restriction endonuclease subunit S n=1 Tax=Streptomyces longwoodensis TaxID=68231 RepID=UPI00340F32BA